MPIIIIAALMIMMSTIALWLILAFVVWKVFYWLFFFGRDSIYWTKYPNLNGALFGLIVIGSIFLLVYVGSLKK